MRQGKSKYVFPGNNTPQGFYSFYQQGLRGLERIFILKGGPGVGKSTLIRKIGSAMMERGYDVEFWQCSSDNDSLDGLIIPALMVGIVDGTAPHIVDPVYPGAVDEIVNLGNFWDGAYLREHKEEIVELTSTISEYFTQGYQTLSVAGELSKQKDEIYNPLLDREKINIEADNLVEEIFHKTPLNRHLFASAITPKGMVSFSRSISLFYSHRYLLQGEAGIAKSLLMEKIAKTAEAHGHAIEVYHTPLDVDKIEMLLLPGLDIAILDYPSDADWKIFPEDKIIDAQCFFTALPEENKKVGIIDEKIQKIIQEASQKIAAAKSLHDKLEVYYNKAMNFEDVDQESNTLFNKILVIANNKEK